MTDYFVYQLREAGQEKPFYVGKGKGNRPFDHIKEARDWNGVESKRKNYFKLKTIRKIERNGCEVVIDFMYKDLTTEQAFILEKKIISYWGRRDNGTGILTNLSDGGEGVVNRSEEGSDGIRRANRMRKWTEESKQKMSRSKIGTVPSDEARRNMSISQSARGPMPKVTREAILRANIGRNHTEESKKKMSENSKGIGAKKFVITHPNGKITIEENISKFAQSHGLTATMLCRMLKGKRKSHGGYTGYYFSEVL